MQTVIQELPTLEMCVNEAYACDEFVEEFNRLNNASLKSGNGFYNLIDEATGKKEEDLKKFIELVDMTIYRPLLAQMLQKLHSVDEEERIDEVMFVETCKDAKCCMCGVNSVDSAHGYDTCSLCLSNIE